MELMESAPSLESWKHGLYSVGVRWIRAEGSTLTQHPFTLRISSRTTYDFVLINASF